MHVSELNKATTVQAGYGLTEEGVMQITLNIDIQQNVDALHGQDGYKLATEQIAAIRGRAYKEIERVFELAIADVVVTLRRQATAVKKLDGPEQGDVKKLEVAAK